MLNLLVSLFILAQAPDSTVRTCDSFPDPDRFARDYSADLCAARVLIKLAYFPKGIAEPAPNVIEQWPVTAVTINIPSDPPAFWRSVLRNGLESVLTQAPADPSSQCIRSPNFTCGCGTMSVKVELASDLRAFTISLDNCDVKYGRMRLLSAGKEYTLTLKKRNAASMREYLQKLLDLALPRQYGECGI